MERSSCLTCGQTPETFHVISGTEDISNVICQHFWFQTDVLQTAIICELCWQTVYQFHCFYENVRKHHEQLAVACEAPNSIFIKREAIEFEADVERSTVEEDVLLGEEGKVEITEDPNQLSIQADQLPSASMKQIKRRSSDGHTVKKLTKKKIAQNRKSEFDQRRQTEDTFIKQHLPYNCDECPLKFEDFISIRRHRIDVHGKEYIACCGNQYTSRRLLFQHVQGTLNPEAFKCELCNKTYKLNVGYVNHKQRCHPNDDPFRCDQCPKRFTTQAALDRHIAIHARFQKEKPSERPKCEICGKSFYRALGLKEHMDAVHEKKAVYVCEICTKPFARQWMFKEHRMTHEYTADELKKQCPICKRWQKNLRLWKKHMSRHKGEGAHKCDQCEHVSVSLIGLKQHVDRMHEKKLECVCDLCGKVYGHPVTLKEHVANAHTKKPLYQCRFCEKKFYSCATMSTHRKKEHPKEWQEYMDAKYGFEKAGKVEDHNSV
nr:zinc finger protein 729-like [Aedes albopictus]